MLKKIPEALKKLNQWILWREETRNQTDKSPTKVPYQVNGLQAKSNDPETWSNYQTASQRFLLGSWSGLGFVFSAGDPFCGIDLDGCRDPETGKVSEWAKKIILDINSYAEVSPSKTGVKIFVRGKSPLDSGKKINLTEQPVCEKRPGIEVYDKLRYFAVTGERMSGMPHEPQERQEALNRYCKGWFPVVAPHAGPAAESSVSERASKYLEKMPPAVSGQSGHNTAFRTACVLVKGFGLSVDEAYPLYAHWNQSCQPPWSEKEMRHKLGDAANTPGEVGYLRDVPMRMWNSVVVPDYKQPAPLPQRETLHSAAKRHLEKVKSGESPLVSLGVAELDNAIGGGVDFGELVVVGARPGHGKAQPLDSKVLTPSGFVEMGDVCVGDEVVGVDGKPTCVVAVHPQGELPVFCLTFSDGTTCECNDEHLWFTQTRNERRRNDPGSVKPLWKIVETLKRTDSPNASHHVVPMVAPVEFVKQDDLPLNPYLLGLLLGDGSFGSSIRFCKPEADLHSRVREILPPGDEAVDAERFTLRIKTRQKNNERSETAKALAALGLDGLGSKDKFIPETYQYASPDERLLLLKGLLDTDGHVTKEGTTVEYSTSSTRLADGVQFIARSLGATVRSTKRIPVFAASDGSKKNGAENHRIYISFNNGIVPVSSQKHLARWKTSTRSIRTLVEVELVGHKECQCITVAASDGLYVTDGFTVTHNSALGLQITYAAISQGMPCLILSEEMSAMALGKRAIQFSSEVAESEWKYKPELVERDLDRLFDCKSKCFVSEAVGTAERAAQVVRECVENDGVKLAVIDYAQLFQGKGGTRYEQVTNTSIIFRKLASSLNIILIVLCQLNREIEKREKFQPKTGDLKDSGQLEQDADVVMFLVWPWRLDSSKEPSEYFVFIGKTRNRETRERTVKCRFEASRQMIIGLNPVDERRYWDKDDDGGF